jgi:hypothetical protein
MCNGKTASVYDYYSNSRYMMTGTIEDICKFFNLSKQALWARVDRTKKAKMEGRETKNTYELELAKESVNEYVMFIDGEFVAKGTVKEICEKTDYKRSYIDQIINGSYGKKHKKKSSIVIYKKVG